MTDSIQESLSKAKEILDGCVESWEQRTGKTWSTPTNSDFPCYYCLYQEEDLSICSVCIHNPKAAIWNLIGEDDAIP